MSKEKSDRALVLALESAARRSGFIETGGKVPHANTPEVAELREALLHRLAQLRELAGAPETAPVPEVEGSTPPLSEWEYFGRTLRIVNGDREKGEPGYVGEVWIGDRREGRVLFGPRVSWPEARELTERHATEMRPNLTRG